VDTRADLDEVEKRKFLTLRGLELRPFGHPVIFHRTAILFEQPDLFLIKYSGNRIILETKLI
jgi:hypothetical protein